MSRTHRQRAAPEQARAAPPATRRDGTVVVQITDAGVEAFLTWLGQPIRRLRQIRQDFLLKLYFSRLIPGHDTPGLIDRQIAACRTVADELQAAADAEPPESFARLVYQSRRATADATIHWLEAEREQSFATASQSA